MGNNPVQLLLNANLLTFVYIWQSADHDPPDSKMKFVILELDIHTNADALIVSKK